MKIYEACSFLIYARQIFLSARTRIDLSSFDTFETDEGSDFSSLISVFRNTRNITETEIPYSPLYSCTSRHSRRRPISCGRKFSERNLASFAGWLLPRI